MPLKIFEDLRDCYINSKNVLKNQTRFKSDLSEIKIGGNKLVNTKNTIKNHTNFFDLEEKVINSFRYYSFLLLNLSTKQNMEKESKY